MELQGNVRKWGNSAGVLLPREWLGKQVQIILIDRTLEIKKEVLDILNEDLEDIIGIYLTGSYARGEQEKDSDIDIVAISNNTKKQIKSGKYDVLVITLDSVKKTIMKNPILILPRLLEAKSILNSSLLDELKNIRVSKNSFNEYLKETERIIKINQGFLDIDAEQEREYLDSLNIVYSLVLRLRGIFLIKCILAKNKYSKKLFIKFLENNFGDESRKIYKIYKCIRDDVKMKEKVRLESIKKLIGLLKKEISDLK